MLSRILLGLVSVILIFGVSNGGGIKDVVFEGLTMIEGEDILKMDIQLEKLGPTKFSVNGTLKHFKLFDDNWKLRFEISRTKFIQDPRPFHLQYPSKEGEGVCEFLKKEYRIFFYETLKHHSNAPHYETCPLEPNEYTVTNYPFDADIFRTFLVFGHYEMVLVMQLNEDVVKYKLRFSVKKNV